MVWTKTYIMSWDSPDFHVEKITWCVHFGWGLFSQSWRLFHLQQCLYKYMYIYIYQFGNKQPYDIDNMNPHCKLNSNVSYVSWKSSQNPSKDKKIPDVFKLNEPFPKTTNNYGWNNSPCHLEASKSSRMKTHPAAPVVNPHALVALEKNCLKLTFKYLQWAW